MSQVQVKKTTIKKKNSSGSQKKLKLRKVAVNNSMNRFRASMR